MNFIRTERGLTVFTTGKTLSVTSDDARWSKAVELLAKDDEAGLIDLLTPAERLNKYVSATGLLKVEGGVLLYKDKPLANNMHMVQRALQQSAEGFPVTPLLNFIENLMENPSFRAQQELLTFLERGELPLTPDGHFLAYKRVRENYFDVHSGTVNNAVGQVVEMPRASVDDNSENTCSYGLHFCSREYLNHFSGPRMMVLKINPRDVVSIPKDYNDTKGRCCRYEVVGELPEEYDPNRGNAWETSVVDAYDDAHPETDEEPAAKTPEFQVGDQVRVVDETDLFYSREGVVREKDGSSLPYYVDFGTDHDQEWCRAEELELITSSELLAVGTRVTANGTIYNGAVGTIVKVDPDDYILTYWVQFDTAVMGDEYWWFSRGELTVLEPKEPVTVSTSYEPTEGEIVRTDGDEVVRVLDDYGRQEEGHGRYRCIVVNTQHTKSFNSDQLRPLN